MELAVLRPKTIAGKRAGTLTGVAFRCREIGMDT